MPQDSDKRVKWSCMDTSDDTRTNPVDKQATRINLNANRKTLRVLGSKYKGGRRGRRRKRCRNCAKLLKEDSDEEFCDETCQSMDTERSKKEDFVNIFQQKEAAERRRIRKWLMDAQDSYSKQQGDVDALTGEGIRGDPDSPSRSGGPSYAHTRSHYVQEHTRLKRNEVITGGPVTLNPVPLRRVPVKSDRPRHHDTNSLTHSYDNDKRQVMIDLKWIPKFFGQQ